MENPIIVPFDLNTARKIKSGEIEGSVLIGNIKIEFVYESKDCADRYNLLFVKKDESGISAIYADTEGRTFFNNVLELEVEAGAYFKKGDVLISTPGNPFIYNGIINREGDMGCIYGTSNRYCLIGPIECNEKLIEVFKKGITVKLKYVEKRVLDTFTDNGIDLSNYTHCIIVKRNFYLAW